MNTGETIILPFIFTYYNFLFIKMASSHCLVIAAWSIPFSISGETGLIAIKTLSFLFFFLRIVLLTNRILGWLVFFFQNVKYVISCLLALWFQMRNLVLILWRIPYVWIVSLLLSRFSLWLWNWQWVITILLQISLSLFYLEFIQLLSCVGSFLSSKVWSLEPLYLQLSTWPLSLFLLPLGLP